MLKRAGYVTSLGVRESGSTLNVGLTGDANTKVFRDGSTTFSFLMVEMGQNSHSLN